MCACISGPTLLFSPAGDRGDPVWKMLHLMLCCVQVFSNHHHPEVVSMGLTDIPTTDLFGPFADKELFNKTFEDLCISDDDSESDM